MALQLTGLEPRPLSRGVNEELADALDTAMSETNELLSQQQPICYYHLRSMTLLYDDMETDPTNYAGCVACYLSHDGGKPTVHCYGWDIAEVCWTGKEADAADQLRQHLCLKRYSLFTRSNGVWRFNHAGQLPISAVHPPVFGSPAYKALLSSRKVKEH